MTLNSERHVVPSGTGWEVRKPGVSRASARTATQPEAIERARQIIANVGSGEIVIHSRDGSVVQTQRVAKRPRKRSSTGARGTSEWPPTWFGMAKSSAEDSAERSDEILDEGFGR
ncbi:DUF2188 domain-containing protein [Rhodococcoides kyotonense]|nr:DUF2188 domain-containing protein [Rhodococcus kyotonensis]